MTASRLVQTSVFQTESFGELQDAFAGWDQRYFQLSPGQFKGSMDLTQVRDNQVFRESWSRKIRYQGTAPPGAFGFALPVAQSGPANWVGQATCANTVILQAPGREADLVSSENWDALVLSVSEDEVFSIVSAYSGDGDISGRFHGTITLKPDAADRLRRVGLDFLRRAKLLSSEGATSIALHSEQFIRLFLWEVVKAQESSNFVLKPAKSSDIVRQATDLVLSDRTSTYGLTEICTHTGVSLRTLHYAFQKVTGLSPATWLRRIRLNRVHKALLRASPDETLVKQVALDNGFLHLGHFGKQYKGFFGCLPTQTLQSSRSSGH